MNMTATKTKLFKILSTRGKGRQISMRCEALKQIPASGKNIKIRVESLRGSVVKKTKNAFAKGA